MDYFSLKNKNIIITGASSGIGKVCAIECSRIGANVVLLGRDIKRLNEVLTEIELLKHNEENKILIYSIDLLNNLNELSSIVDEIVLKIGKIDGFIHAAGIEKTLPITAMKELDFENIFKVNALSGFELAKIVSKKKNINERASFVFISSITSVIGRIGVVGYAASKGALVSGAKSMALELAPKKINVNCISPGTILTPMMIKYLDSIPEEERIKRKDGFPLGLGNPIDISNAAIFLLSEASKWITGQNIIVDGGYTSK